MASSVHPAQLDELAHLAHLHARDDTPCGSCILKPSKVASGNPHLEEAYWFGEGVLPILERGGGVTRPRAAWPGGRIDRSLPWNIYARAPHVSHAAQRATQPSEPSARETAAS